MPAALAAFTVWFPASTFPLRSTRTERPAPKSRRLRVTASAPRLVPLLALRLSGMRLKLIHLIFFGWGFIPRCSFRGCSRESGVRSPLAWGKEI